MQNTENKSTSECQIVFRTNVETLDADDFDKIDAELEQINQVYERMLSVANYRPAFTKLYSGPYLYSLDQIYQSMYDEIITDQEDIFKEIGELKGQNKVEAKIRLYQDENLSLANLYSLESRLKEAVETRIWLKSGGYLVIEPTEALTVIDVNTGKYDAKTVSMEETVLNINLEAAKEVAHQLMVRNLSGIIIVDFINMDTDAHNTLVLNALKTAVANDCLKTNVIGFTKLGLVELTRKKKNKPLKDILIW